MNLSSFLSKVLIKRVDSISMSTNARIGIENPDGTIDSIYCHFDAYDHYDIGAGYLLKTYYLDESKVRELIALGDISYLAEKIGEKHSFSNPTKGWTLAYGRDGEEENTSAIRVSSRDEYKEYDEPFLYLFTIHKEWVRIRRQGEE